MNITNRTSLVGFLVALSALSVPKVAAAANPDSNQVATYSMGSPSIEDRLSRLSIAFRDRAEQLPAEERADAEQFIAIGFADGAGRGWVNGDRGGWVDGHGGSFVNVRPWYNGWGDGGRFSNWRNGWGDGGRFSNWRNY